MKQHENIVKKLNIYKLGVGIIFFFFLIYNLISSQTVSPIYFQIMSNNKKATISFLEKIKTFSEFQKILVMNKNIFGNLIEKETFRQENDKKVMINNLEQALIKNPKARDILYSLYLLYKGEGDSFAANKYLRQAKEIDPAIGL